VWVGDVVLSLSDVWTTTIMSQAGFIYVTLVRRHNNLSMSVSWLPEKPCELYEDSEWPVRYMCWHSTVLHLYTTIQFSLIQLYSLMLVTLIIDTQRGNIQYSTAGIDDNICGMGRRRFASCVTKAIDTHSEYVILIPLPRQQ